MTATKYRAILPFFAKMAGFLDTRSSTSGQRLGRAISATARPLVLALFPVPKNQAGGLLSGCPGYMTIAERRVSTGGAREQWRLCMVTNALGRRKLRILNAKSFGEEFALEPIAFRFFQKNPKPLE